MNYMMKADGSFYRILIAPVRRASIVAGQLLEAVLCTFLEVFIMGTISLLFSVEFSAGIGALLAPGENRHFEPGENNQFQPGRNRQSVPGGCSQPRFECRF